MLKRPQFYEFSSENLIALYLGFYNQEFGNKKSLEIINKIDSSKQVKNFIEKLRSEKLNPGVDGFISVVNASPYFLFSKGETLCYGSLYALKKWLGISATDLIRIPDTTIQNIVIETIFKADKTKLHLSSKLSFFEKYYKLLEETLINN